MKERPTGPRGLTRRPTGPRSTILPKDAEDYVDERLQRIIDSLETIGNSHARKGDYDRAGEFLFAAGVLDKVRDNFPDEVENAVTDQEGY